ALIYRVNTFQKSDAAGAIEQVEDEGKTLVINEKDYVMVYNFKDLTVRWNDGAYAYSIAGKITEEELTQIIKSIK
ncbi:MAG: DUF4367 domain-containing protein, partial [Clostridia bacterium]